MLGFGCLGEFSLGQGPKTGVFPSASAALLAQESGDLFVSAILAWYAVNLTYVDIIQSNPRIQGYLGVVENVAQSSIVASIAEPQTIPSTGTPVSTVAGARIAIITGP